MKFPKFKKRLGRKKDESTEEEIDLTTEEAEEEIKEVEENKKKDGVFSNFINRFKKDKPESETDEPEEVVEEKPLVTPIDELPENKSKTLATGEKSVIGGWFSDRDSRTFQSVKQLVALIVALTFITIGSVWTVFGVRQYNHYLETNTTPIGTEVAFSDSNIPIVVKEVWRDKNDTIVVHVGYTDQARNLLSSNGKNYGLTILVGKERHKPDNLDVSYGMLGTDGDGYLIMKGDFEDRAYQVVMENLSNLKIEDMTDEEYQEFINESQSITTILSQHSKQDIQDDGQINVTNEEDDKIDIASFRVNPYSESTRIYDGTFTDEDGSIDYDTIVRATSVNDIVNGSKLNVRKALDTIEILENQKSEYIERLEENKDDRSARSQLPEVDRQIETQEEIIEKSIRQIRFLEQFEFSEKDFGNRQTDFKLLVF